jgi:copper homeostasis protein
LQILLEVCVGSAADIETAIAAGANRLELCSALELGGLTPSIGLVEAALSMSPLPIVVMVRPRAGGFCYDRHEFAAMLRDAKRFVDLGASGIVFGILDQQGSVDVARSQELVKLAGALDSVFHRGIDFVRDQRAAIDSVIELGCTRVLTSGGKRSAHEGATAIRDLITHAAGRIEILPGGGINAANVMEIVNVTACSQVHIGAATAHDDGSIDGMNDLALCDGRFMQGTAYRGVAGDVVSAVKAAIRTPAANV